MISITFYITRLCAYMRIFTVFVHGTYHNMEIFCQKKFAIRLIYDTTTTKYKVSFFYFKKFSQTLFEFLSYFPFLPPPPTGLVSHFFSDLSRNNIQKIQIY